jgi:hypothetical protein
MEWLVEPQKAHYTDAHSTSASYEGRREKVQSRDATAPFSTVIEQQLTPNQYGISR